MELSQDIRDLAPAMERHRQTVLRADRRSKAGIIFGIIGVSVAVVATIYAIDARDLQQEYERDQANNRVSACIQFNAQRNEIRQALKDALIALAPPDRPLTPTQQATVDRYAAEVDLKLPYRDCSPAGLEAYFKAPPADPAENK